MGEKKMTTLLCLVFVSELYHSVAHCIVLTGYRLLPRTNVVAAQWYFIWDLLAAALAYYIHIFYLTTWDKSWAAKRVISWSSLEWDRGRWNQVDLVLGTIFDIGVHAANTYFLGTLLSLGSVIPLTMVTLLGVISIMQGSRFAWASKTKIPDWIRERIKPLTSDQRQEIQWLDKLVL